MSLNLAGELVRPVDSIPQLVRGYPTGLGNRLAASPDGCDRQEHCLYCTEPECKYVLWDRKVKSLELSGLYDSAQPTTDEQKKYHPQPDYVRQKRWQAAQQRYEQIKVLWASGQFPTQSALAEHIGVARCTVVEVLSGKVYKKHERNTGGKV